MADTGWLNPSSAVDSSTSWANPENVLGDDGSGSSASWGAGTTTSDLRITTYGASIPTSATIDGIEVQMDKLPSTSGTVELLISMTKNATTAVGGATGSALANEISGHGGPTDLWGTTWTPSEINATTFGVIINGYDDASGSGQANLDIVQIKVYYTPPTIPVTYYLPAKRRGR